MTTETLAECENVSLIVSVHVPEVAEVRLRAPLATAPYDKILAQPLTAYEPLKPGSVTVTVCVPALENERLAGEADNGPIGPDVPVNAGSNSGIGV
jgi:hypothetical protein